MAEYTYSLRALPVPFPTSSCCRLGRTCEGEIEMSALVEKMKRHHQEIVHHLEAIRAANYQKNVAVEELGKAKNLILAHLKLEDAELYPLLKQKGQTDPAIARVAEDFARRMEPLSQEVMAFFERYNLDGGAQDLGIGFVRDLGGMINKLSNRVRQEEGELYPLVDK
jgi:hypothetical protein